MPGQEQQRPQRRDDEPDEAPAPVPAGAASQPQQTATATSPDAAAAAGAAGATSTAVTTAPQTTTVTPAGGTKAPTATTPAPTVGNVLGRLDLYSKKGTAAGRRGSSGGISDAAIALAAAGALVALFALAWALARMTGYEPRWTLSLRHSLAEAGHRTSATWAELGDWVRLGR